MMQRKTKIIFDWIFDWTKDCRKLNISVNLIRTMAYNWTELINKILFDRLSRVAIEKGRDALNFSNEAAVSAIELRVYYK